jgi:uncharacterized membrane protein YqjE
MIHPLFRLLISEPQMLADHLAAYSELVAEEIGTVTTQWKRRAALHALSLVGVIVSAVLIGMALLLWAAVPIERMNAPWALIVVPAVFLALTAWAHVAARAPARDTGFHAVREQLAADAAMLHSVTAP